MPSQLSPLDIKNASIPSEINLLQSPPIVLSPSLDSSRPSSPASTKVTTPSSPSKLSSLSSLVSNVHRTTGQIPPAAVGATSTIIGDKLYVFGGKSASDESSAPVANLYELDLCHRHWTLLQTQGIAPKPRYFHSTCSLGDSKLVCYGGMACDAADVPSNTNEPNHGGREGRGGARDKPVPVFSDIHIFDIPSLTWTPIPTSQSPVGRYAHTATIIPSSSTLVSSNSVETLPLFANGTTNQQARETVDTEIDGTGGAELVIIGGQDTLSLFIQQVSIFNLRSLQWTRTIHFPREFGQYRGCAVPLNPSQRDRLAASKSGNASHLHLNKNNKEDDNTTASTSEAEDSEASTFLMYANYNISDPLHELHVQLPNDELLEQPIYNDIRPPFIRFPYGGLVNNHLIIGGIDLTNNHHEYSLKALNLQTLTWSRIDTGSSILSHGSWNIGALWARRNIFVVQGHRRRDLRRDYKRRRINYEHLCFVELEPLGLYENPRHKEPLSSFVSNSTPVLPPALQTKYASAGAGRPHFAAAIELGKLAMEINEMADMEILTLDEERVPVNSHMLSKRWGPYFIHLLREASETLARQNTPQLSRTTRPVSSMRPTLGMNRSMTANTPLTTAKSFHNSFNRESVFSTFSSPAEEQSSPMTPTKNSTSPIASEPFSPDPSSNIEPPSTHVLAPTSRHRVLYLPHTLSTVRLLVHFLYTNTLPPPEHPHCTAQALCSLLQLARPYQIDGLLEATVERLHQVFDEQSAAAVFNAAAMAAGGGRGTGFWNVLGVPSSCSPDGSRLRGPWESETSSLAGSSEENSSARPDTSISMASVSTNPSFPGDAQQHATISARPQRRPRGLSRLNVNSRMRRSESLSSVSTAESAGTDPSATDSSASYSTSNPSIPPASQKTDLHPPPPAPAHLYEHKIGWQSVASDISSLSTQSQVIDEESSTSYPHHSHPPHQHQQHLRNSGDTSGGATTSSMRRVRDIWTGTTSSVIGLQKRGLRELMAGRRIRGRAASRADAGNSEGLSPVSPLSVPKKNDEDRADTHSQNHHDESSQVRDEENTSLDKSEIQPDTSDNSIYLTPDLKSEEVRSTGVNVTDANAQRVSPMASPSIASNQPAHGQAQ